MSGKTILPGATLGVMGGGQLGRMFVQAAQAMGYFTAVLDADPASPAGLVAHYHIDTGYLDEQGLAQLMQRSAAITTEFENVPAAALVTLGAHRPVAPAAEAVAICQDRAEEKALFRRAGVPCAPHARIETEAELAAVPDSLLPGILKTARLGYDGKGQVRVADRAALAAAWAQLRQVPCVLEAMLPLALELSVVVARNAFDDVVQLPVQQNLHRDGILAVTQVPAPDVAPALQQQASDCAAALARALGYVGVLCVEFFVLKDPLPGPDGTWVSLVANEMAPRPHNSGHWSVDGSDVSQFELQVRTLTGLPLVAPRQHSPAVMLNLLGDLWFPQGADAAEATPPWAQVLALPGVHLHLYGKASARPGRKMGHLTVTADTAAMARTVASQAAALLGLPAF
ncbi:5-(carboxyamino)imidazole ribonucleotide synthase [Aquabacterium sp. OR-4]|uniref:5-(carboxyamino)imidazole ribonucleotide synthase n=1 Tax=Aquabacterium sp. OR-4 TaxID=2978127 RepID=UPI0028C7CE8C|nr:5-(carboxyamino)imidazole ribonucleotide synthase [Aquabacterium sp. OR-4]MDT7837425.1 5-(carboxyamino)imidazole ribonucleotide synthase [Aquabacterium sp. OR-4]